MLNGAGQYSCGPCHHSHPRTQPAHSAPPGPGRRKPFWRPFAPLTAGGRAIGPWPGQITSTIGVSLGGLELEQEICVYHSEACTVSQSGKQWEKDQKATLARTFVQAGLSAQKKKRDGCRPESCNRPGTIYGPADPAEAMTGL